MIFKIRQQSRTHMINVRVSLSIIKYDKDAYTTLSMHFEYMDSPIKRQVVKKLCPDILCGPFVDKKKLKI